MLSKEDNELICRIGPGTPMGEAIRHFWLPAALSAELPEPDGDPMHVELMGQNFVAFRDSNGKVGLLDEYCCHRGASLTIGRVEKCGIRCIYHGWLFAADGTVLETPNVPDERFKQRVKAKSYPVREAAGIIWAYLGPAEKMPPFPDFPWIDAPPNKVRAAVQINGCNFVQMFEALMDSSHVSLLHASSIEIAQGQDLNFVRSVTHMKEEAAPKFDAEETAFGVHYAAQRFMGGKAETRITAYLAPFWQINPQGMTWIAPVPMTDEKTAFFTVWWDGVQEFGDETGERQMKMLGLDQETMEKYGQTRKTFYSDRALSRANNFGQDRALMRSGHFTGVPSFALEDSTVGVSAGPLRDRTKETLCGPDVGIALYYRSMIKSAKQVRDGGTPIGYGLSVAKLRGLPVTLEVNEDWRALVPDHFHVPPQLEAAE